MEAENKSSAGRLHYYTVNGSANASHGIIPYTRKATLLPLDASPLCVCAYCKAYTAHQCQCSRNTSESNFFYVCRRLVK